MARYCLFDFAIESGIPLDAPGSILSPTFRFCVDHSPQADISDVRPGTWLVEYQTPDQGLWLSIAKIDGIFLLRFHDLADFLVSEDGEIVCRPRAGVGDATIRHLLVVQVVPRILKYRGEIVLHGCAVTPNGVSIAFLGQSGAGKSTLTAGFAKRGIEVVTDDCLLIRKDGAGYLVVPSYPEIRMWPDTMDALFRDSNVRGVVDQYAGKRVLGRRDDTVSFAATEARLVALVFLAPEPSDVLAEGHPLIRIMTTADAHTRLVACMFRMVPPDAASSRSEFDLLSDLVEGVPCHNLVYLRDHSRLDEVIDLVLDRVAG